MAKPKQQPASAAQRREQERQQREQRQQRQERQQRSQSTVQARSSQNRGPTIHKDDRGRWYMIGGVLLLIAVIIVAFVLINVLQSKNNVPQPADSAVVNTITNINQTTWRTVGTGQVKNPFQAVTGQPVLKGPTGKPQVFYAGGDFCPYCAGERWAIITALSRFGTFGHLSQLQSNELNISTFSFYQSTYTSQYIDFVPVEKFAGDQSTILQNPTADQQKLIDTYDSGGGIPFIDVGNQYVTSGASYDVTVLLDASQNSRSWKDIANSITDPTSSISHGVLGTGNYITAAVCKITNQQPGSVCNDSIIQQIEQSLGKTGAANAGTASPLAIVPAISEAAFRQRPL